MYGIPEVRLPKALVQKEIDAVKQLGVTIRTNMVIGTVLSLVDLTVEGYEGILIGSGAGLPSFMKIPGENLNGVYLLRNFWLVLTLMKAYSSQKRIDLVKSGLSSRKKQVQVRNRLRRLMIICKI